jgi:hypothetical protein
MPTKISRKKLQTILDQLYHSYLLDFQKSPAEFFTTRQDPLSFAHRYTEFHDIEAAAFLASTFAYGKVQSLCAFVETLLAMLGPSPYQFLRQGPLESYDAHSTIVDSIERFVGRLYEIHGSAIPFLLPSPGSGSPCKRLNLFLRWMVRRDGLDLGIWKEVSPADLMIPLDTHIGRVAFQLGWIKTPSLSWKKAEEVTAVLRRFNPDDPIRYDFSLCHESFDRKLNWDRR